MQDINNAFTLKLMPPLPVIFFVVLFFAVIAGRLGTDASPDFRIYHFYNGFAAFHDRGSLDIVPAQLQTMLFNGVDAFNYALFRSLNHHPILINCVLSLPYSLAAICAFILVRVFLPFQGILSVVLCTVVAIFGITGAGELTTLATAMTDVTADVPFLAGLAYWFSRERVGKNTLTTSLIVGALGGASVGLKLTTVPYFIGLFLVIGIRQLLGIKSAWREAAVFGFIGISVFLLIDHQWLIHNFLTYGNPIMPNLNNIFKSDFVAHGSWADTRFLPKSFMMAVFYPAYWAFWKSQDTIELPMRDARILIGCLSTLFILVMTTYREITRQTREPDFKTTNRLALYFSIIFLVAYALWEMEWSIYRYLAIDECLSGVALLVALRIGLPSVSLASLTGLFAIVAVPTAATTHYPWWSRAQPGPDAITVSLPALEPDAMVIFLDPYAYSYLVPFMPRSVHVVGANNNIIHPGAWGKLQAEAEAAINSHSGPFWGMEFPRAFPGTADDTLGYYHLHRKLGTCVIVDSNIEDGPNIRMCRLTHN